MGLFNRAIKKIKLLLPVILAAMLAFGMSCRKKDQPAPSDTKPTFDKQALLVNLADNLIIPAYTRFGSSLKSFSSKLDSVITAGSLPDHFELRSRFYKVYSDYQRISIFGFGPGEDEAIRVNFNIFPCDTSKVMDNVRTGSYDLSQASSINAKGLPAIDYLLHDSTITGAGLPAYTDKKRLSYIKSLVAEMKQRSGSALSAWLLAYRSTFINSLGTDVGSSIGFVINQVNYELDYLKNAKLATPVGLRSGGTPHPDNCEAYNSQRSMQYAHLTLNAIESLYAGISLSGNNGPGLDDYLNHLDIKRGTGPLTQAISNQFVIARQKMQAVNDPLSHSVITQKEEVEAAYTELVKLLVLLKTDMPSALGVAITYQDGDGD